MKQKILLVGDYNRNDFLFIAKELKNEADFFFIEYLNEKELRNKDCLQLGKVLFWKDYSDAYDLLEKIKPGKVLFYFIESFNHVALNVAAKMMLIPTYHLEHGLRFSPNFQFVAANKSPVKVSKNKIFKLLSLGISTLIDKYNNRQFYLKSVLKSPPSAQVFLKSFYQVRSTHSIHETFHKIKDPLRVADKYISFSPAIFNYHKEMDGLSENHPVYFTGIPQFDKFFYWKDLKTCGQDILFIDQPLYEQQLLGWTKEFKINFVEALINTISRAGKKLYIKPHPGNDQSVYSLFKENIHVKLIEDDWESVIPHINTVLGFSSTLLLPFLAMNHICCLTLEIHPQPGKIPYSKLLLETGACKVVKSMKELESKLIQREEWYLSQIEQKPVLIEKWLYKFDGKSTERLRTILMRDEAA